MKTARILALCAVLFAVGTFFTGETCAHDSRPIFVQIDLRDQGQTLLSWKIPDSVLPEDAPDVVLTGGCTVAMSSGRSDGLAVDRPVSRPLQGIRWYTCDPVDSRLSVVLKFPGTIPSLATLVRVEWPDGSTQTVHAAPGVQQIDVQGRALTTGVLQHYLVLGIEHILRGYDHLLFVACLVLLAGSFKRTALAVSGFTAAHSMTLGAAAMGYVTVPVLPVEAAIALSIVFLAAELVRGRQDTLTWRHPMLVAGLFGLLHGFGFAAVLGDIGLPDHESLIALLGFNLGVEVGQLGFVLVLIAGLYLFSRFHSDSVRTMPFTRIVAYPIGALASFWLIERLSLFV